MSEICKLCRLLQIDDVPDGIRVTRSYHFDTGGIKIVAFGRHNDKRYGKGFILEAEFLEDTTGAAPIEQQLQVPAVVAELERLTALAIASVRNHENRVDLGGCVELESGYHSRQKVG